MISKPNIKPYSQEMDKDNKWVEMLILGKIVVSNHKVIKNPDKYGIDLLVLNSVEETVGGIECEKHGKYWLKTFDFPTVHFLGRKAKFVNSRCFYLMVNLDGSNVVMISFAELPKCPTILKDTPHTHGESFYEVSKERCVWGWVRVNEKLDQFYNLAISDFM